MIFFFFKQKTAYEMRISDWSSDVCSSDLSAVSYRRPANRVTHAAPTTLNCCITSTLSPPWGTGRAMRGASQNNNNKAGGTHVQGALVDGAFPERDAARPRDGVDLPGPIGSASRRGEGYQVV